jgi:hypothetical protein
MTDTGSSERPPLMVDGGVSHGWIGLTKIDHSVRAIVPAVYE